MTTKPATTTVSPFKAIRRAAVPICAYETADPAKTIQNCLRALNGKANESPTVQWDVINGVQPLNEAGKEFVSALCGQNPPETIPITDYLKTMQEQTPRKAIFFFHNAHRFIVNEAIMQGVWNLRDKFKAIGATLVLLAPQITLPAELKQDAVIISEDLPGEAEITGIIDSIAKDAAENLTAEAKAEIEANKGRYVDTLRGLSSFAAEQVVAMSLSKDGIDQDGLWQRKRKMIEQTPGLSVWQGGETFDDLGGLSNLKEFLTRVLTSGKTPVRAIGFIDEIEKGLAGSAGDTSGTSQDQLQVFLKVMQDLDIPGIILLGHAGTGKSAIAKAAGNVASAPVIAIDTGSMKGSLVGESEARIRAAMDVFKAVSQGKGLFIATCNKIASLPPELRRRFTLGTFFVDLPSEVERTQIWKVWLKRYNVTADQGLPECIALSASWTGAEIRACCDVAFRTGLPIAEAARFVVPVIKSAPDQVAALRAMANGRFISASYAGVYETGKTNETKLDTGGRKMDL